mgnify:CR=1 FL=1
MKKLLLLLLLIPALLGAEEDRKPTKKEWQKAKKMLEDSKRYRTETHWSFDEIVENPIDEFDVAYLESSTDDRISLIYMVGFDKKSNRIMASSKLQFPYPNLLKATYISGVTVIKMRAKFDNSDKFTIMVTNKQGSPFYLFDKEKRININGQSVDFFTALLEAKKLFLIFTSSSGEERIVTFYLDGLLDLYQASGIYLLGKSSFAP